MVWRRLYDAGGKDGVDIFIQIDGGQKILNPVAHPSSHFRREGTAANDYIRRNGISSSQGDSRYGSQEEIDVVHFMDLLQKHR